MVDEIVAGDAEGAAVGHGLVGVDDEVADDLADLAGIDFRGPEFFAEGEFAPALRAAEGEADGVLDEFGDGGGLLNRRAAAGEGEELLGEIARAEGGVLGVVQAAAHLVVRREDEGGEGDVADDGGEEVVEIVRNAAGEQAELFQGIGFASLGFIALTFGDVAEDKDDADDFVLVIANRGGHLLDDVFACRCGR